MARLCAAAETEVGAGKFNFTARDLIMILFYATWSLLPEETPKQQKQQRSSLQSTAARVWRLIISKFIIERSLTQRRVSVHFQDGKDNNGSVTAMIMMTTTVTSSAWVKTPPATRKNEQQTIGKCVRGGGACFPQVRHQEETRQRGESSLRLLLLVLLAARALLDSNGKLCLHLFCAARDNGPLFCFGRTHKQTHTFRNFLWELHNTTCRTWAQRATSVIVLFAAGSSELELQISWSV